VLLFLLPFLLHSARDSALSKHAKRARPAHFAISSSNLASSDLVINICQKHFMKMQALIFSAALLFFSAVSTSIDPLTYQENGTSVDVRHILTGDDVHWSTGTVVAFPNSTAFTNATERRVAWEAPSFAAVITPVVEEDVAKAVKLAVQHNIPFLATGGRHGSGVGYGKVHGGLAIDLSHFNYFEVHTNSSIVTIGGSATFGEFQHELYAAGLMLPSGSCSCPGYVGLGVGGGIGRRMGSLGLVSDRILSARVVTATGHILDVSNEKHADLFWGIRGAGANLGVIISATFQAAKASDYAGDGHALTIDLYFDAKSTTAYFEHLGNIAGSLPSNVGGLHLTMYNATVNDAELFVNWVWYGPEAEGHAFISQFLSFGPYLVKNYEYITWDHVIAVAGDGIGQSGLCIKEVYANSYASNLKEFATSTFIDTFAKLAQFYAEYPEGRGSSSNLELFSNQAVAALDKDFDAYPWRDTKGFFTVSAYFDTTAQSNQTLLDIGDTFCRDLRDSWSETGGYAEQGGAIYVNYARGDEPIESVWGDSLPRLAALKKQWDPKNVFAYNNPLPTSYP
jgi:FAD/FMN-containing dehydrogenase